MLDMTGSDVNVLPNWPPTHNFPDLQMIFLSQTVFDGSRRCRELECLEKLGLRIIANRCPADLRSGCGFPPCCSWTSAQPPSQPPVSTVTESWSTTAIPRDRDLSTRAMTPSGADASGSEVQRGLAVDPYTVAGITVGILFLIGLTVLCIAWKRGFRVGRTVNSARSHDGGAARPTAPHGRRNRPGRDAEAGRVPPHQQPRTPIFSRNRSSVSPSRSEHHWFSPTTTRSTSRTRHMPTPRPSPFASLFAARRDRDPLPPPHPHEAVVHHNPEYNGLPRNDADYMHHRDHSQDERIHQNVDLGGNNPIPADGGEFLCVINIR
ncbi:uncharacterized protein LOC129587957 [Paramacrobiotus metropolitanus]|uniref:uncharacterized protein LOC129587957 n=1 Tax=Paramacrobiotus metropolitanus TaxID=2943436 RepID=UPI0024459443|nr:uncharacterized protein LOC129587957 [Paramacrobiotus metropolitanus]